MHNEDHEYGQHDRSPRANCENCITAHESSRGDWPSRCAASGRIFTGEHERTNGNGAWATGRCPVCNRKVGITRPTKRTPWRLVGTHGPR